MVQRNMSTNQMSNSEHYQHAQPCVVSGTTSNNPQPSMNHMLPVAEHASGSVPHHPSVGSRENRIPYGITQYNAVLHHPLAGNLGPTTTSNYYNPYMLPPSSSLFPSQLNQGPMCVDGFGGSKRKNSEGYLGSYQCSYSVAGPSSVAPLTIESGSQQNLRRGPVGACPSSAIPSLVGVVSQQSMRPGPVVVGLSSALPLPVDFGSQLSVRPGPVGEGPSSAVPLSVEDGSQQNVRPGPVVAGPSSTVPLSVGGGSQRRVRPGPVVAAPTPAVPFSVEVLSHRSVRTGPVGGETVLAHNQGNFQGQALIPVNVPLLNQRFLSNGGDGGTWAWGQVPAIPYIHGSWVNGGGFTGAGNMIPEQYQEAAIQNFQLYPPPVYPVQGLPQSLRRQPQSVPGAFYSQVPGLSYGPIGTSSSHINVNPFQVTMDVASGYVGLVPQPGLDLYHPLNGRALVPGVTIRHPALPNLSLLPVDEISMLEIPGYYEVVNANDQHRDLRMDVDSMSYEELLALQERIGYVRTGLSENTISSLLQTRTHISSTTSTDLADRKTDFCTICQTSYENKDEIGKLDCGHECHAHCLKGWLVLKNICPICKSPALATKMKDSAKEG